VGSSRSAGCKFSDIWHEKETSLEEHYGKELWQGDRGFPSALHDVQVVTIDQLIALGCRVVISAVAPRLGFLEDKLAAAGITVVSISPYKRQEGALCVLEANHQELSTKLLAALEAHYTTSDGHGNATSTFSKQLHHPEPLTDDAAPAPSLLPLVKSPNCVCCGTSTVLAGLVSLYGPMANVSVTTFQSLSGRGDSKYPAELVVGNVYPLRSTTEPTESLIGEELAHVLGAGLTSGRDSLSVAAYRVSVQRGHLVDVRIKFEDDSVFQSLKRQQRQNNKEEDGEKQLVESIYRQLETWSPIVDSIGEANTRAHLPSVPLHPIQCTREGKW
jgi:aspartate-semialdehyde dehydrogenase